MDRADRVAKRRAERFRVLELIYEIDDSSSEEHREASIEDFEPIVSDEFSADDLERALSYLVDEGLLTSPYSEGTTFLLTHKGRVEYERSVKKPEMETDYFPPIMNITNNTNTIHTMVASQFQQGTDNSTQMMSATVNGNAIEAIRAVLDTFDKHIAATAMGEEVRKELDAALVALRAQTELKKPSTSIVAECLKSARAIVEGIASTALSTAVLPQIGIALAAMGMA